MDLSGVIFVVLAIAWAVYLIPKALKHHDEVARTRSIDKFSTALRVLAHREPTSKSDSRLVVTPARPRHPRPVAPSKAPAPASIGSAPRLEVRTAAVRQRTSARMAARRRRRILTSLLVLDVASVVAAYLAYVPWWSVAVPVLLTAAFLVLCRTQVRHEAVVVRRVRAVENTATEEVVEEVLVEDVAIEDVVPENVVPENVVPEDDSEHDTEDTVGISVAALRAAVGASAATGSLWDPLPVTLPTYVTKPRATRTVRTIDLGEPGTWTSGRTSEDAMIAAKASAGETDAPAESDTDEGGQHAVGS